MTVQNSAFCWNGDTLVLHLFLQPNASQNEWAGWYKSRIRVRVAAPAVENNANRECEKFLSKSFKTAKTNVSVVRGKTVRRKTVEIQKPDPGSWKKILDMLGENV